MPTFTEFKLDDESTLLIEVDDSHGGIVPVARGENSIIEADTKFKTALASVRGSIVELLNELNSLDVEEAEVKFGIKAIGEAGGGVFSIGKVGGEINYEVTLKWKK